MRGEVYEVSGGEFYELPRGKVSHPETRLLESLRKESWGVFQWNFGLRKKINLHCAKQDGESSSEKLSKRQNSQNHRKKLVKGFPWEALRSNSWWRGLCKTRRGLSQLEPGEGGLELSQEKTPNPQGQRVESVVWSSGREGRLVGRGLLTGRRLKTRSIWKGPCNALNSCQANWVMWAYVLVNYFNCI